MALHESTYEPKSRFGKWMDERLPVGRLMHTQFVDFPTPRNLNYLWTFGGILTFFLMAQIVTGIVLAMHYQPSAAEAFDSVEAIRRDVNYGWLIRNLHAVGASMFFLAAYIHIFRGLYYGSYKAPREVLWIIGVLIFIAMMATAFMGYSLPWGQMSFWAVTVITNLFSSLDSIINGLGTTIVQWLWGGYAVSGATLNRFYSLHYLLPFVIAGPRRPAPVGAASRRPEQPHRASTSRRKSDAVPMHPYATSKDAVGMFAFLILFAWFVFFLPDYLGHADNYIAGKPARDAAAHRAGVVLPALLRHPARDPVQALRRHRHVRLDRRAAVRAVARHEPRALDQVPAALPLVLLAVRVHVRGARLPRLQAAEARLCVLGTHLHGLLFRALPRRPAARRPAREAEEAAGLHHRGGAGQGRGASGIRRGGKG